MKKLILTTIVLLIATTAIMANDTEHRLERQIDKNIVNLTNALKKFKSMKTAIANDDMDREATLRKVCDRMKRETKAVSESIAYMDVQLQITQVRKQGTDLKRTRDNINDLKKQIEDLKKGLEIDAVPTIKVATR